MSKTNRERIIDMLADGKAFRLVIKRLSYITLDHMDWDKWLNSTDPKPIYKDVRPAQYSDYNGHTQDCLFVDTGKMGSENYAAIIVSRGTDPLRSDFDDQYLKVPLANVNIKSEKKEG